jgi:hypothetical protein
MTREYEYAVYNKQDHVYHFAVDKPLYSKIKEHAAKEQPAAKA